MTSKSIHDRSILRRKKDTFLVLFIFAASFTIVYLMARILHLPMVTNSQYSAHQAWSLLHGRLDIFTLSRKTHDLSQFHNYVYAYWPPLVAFLMAPFVYGTGPMDFPQRLFSIILCSCNAMIVAQIACTLISERTPYRLWWVILAALTFTFGTSNIIMSLSSSHWLVQQLSASTFLLLSMYFLARYCSNKESASLYLASCMLAFAVLGRTHLILLAPAFFALYLIRNGSMLRSDFFMVMRGICLIALPLVSSIALIGIFNFVRFGGFLDFGMQYQNYRGMGIETPPLLFGPWFVWKNIYIEFLRFHMNPKIDSYPPHEGFSIFLQCPIFLFMIGGQYPREIAILRRSLFLCILGVTVVLLFFAGTGHSQFGARYFYDIAPCVALLVLQKFGFSRNSKWVVALMVVACLISIILNIWGALWWTGRVRMLPF